MTTPLKSVTEILDAQKEVAKTFGQVAPWWRGHAVNEWALVPWVHRILLPRYEANVSQAFFHEAKIRRGNLPPDDNLPAWLFLMQHYRLPTRLLDWSESCLVAAYFAVSNMKHATIPGALWALEPSELNRTQIGRKITLGAGHQHVLNHFSEIIPSESVQNGDEIRTVALNPEHIDVRMMVQSSKFTIHCDGKPLEGLKNPRTFLQKFEIPPSAKESLLQELDSLRINRANLFPDLENLAKDVMTRNFYPDA